MFCFRIDYCFSSSIQAAIFRCGTDRYLAVPCSRKGAKRARRSGAVATMYLVPRIRGDFAWRLGESFLDKGRSDIFAPCSEILKPLRRRRDVLELRPTCEHCNKSLPPNSPEAVICSFECTFCRSCAHKILHNVCPNCGGGFCPRPVRPSRNWKNGNYLGTYPAGQKVVFKPVDLKIHEVFSSEIRDIRPEQR